MNIEQTVQAIVEDLFTDGAQTRGTRLALMDEDEHSLGGWSDVSVARLVERHLEAVSELVEACADVQMLMDEGFDTTRGGDICAINAAFRAALANVQQGGASDEP